MDTIINTSKTHFYSHTVSLTHMRLTPARRSFNRSNFPLVGKPLANNRLKDGFVHSADESLRKTLIRRRFLLFRHIRFKKTLRTLRPSFLRRRLNVFASFSFRLYSSLACKSADNPAANWTDFIISNCASAVGPTNAHYRDIVHLPSSASTFAHHLVQSSKQTAAAAARHFHFRHGVWRLLPPKNTATRTSYLPRARLDTRTIPHILPSFRRTTLTATVPDHLTNSSLNTLSNTFAAATTIAAPSL